MLFLFIMQFLLPSLFIVDFIRTLANTRSPEAPAAADIHLHVSPHTASASVCTADTWALSPALDAAAAAGDQGK